MGQACNCDCDDGKYELYQENVSVRYYSLYYLSTHLWIFSSIKSEWTVIHIEAA